MPDNNPTTGLPLDENNATQKGSCERVECCHVQEPDLEKKKKLDKLLDGLCITRFDNGNVRSRINYLNGIENGLAEYYDKRGRLRRRGEYRNGLPEGYWGEYYDSGFVRIKGVYHLGQKVGTWKWYSSMGRLAISGAYSDNQPVGVWESYFQNGDVRERFFFEDGTLVKKEIIEDQQTTPLIEMILISHRSLPAELVKTKSMEIVQYTR